MIAGDVARAARVVAIMLCILAGVPTTAHFRSASTCFLLCHRKLQPACLHLRGGRSANPPTRPQHANPSSGEATNSGEQVGGNRVWSLSEAGGLQNSETGSYDESGRRGFAARRSDDRRSLSFVHEAGSSGYDLVVDEEEDDGRQEGEEEEEGDDGDEEEGEEGEGEEEMDVDGGEEEDDAYESEDEYVENEEDGRSGFYIRSPRGSLYETHFSSGEKLK
eukprot:766938-Hanusia_phi.AAC.1